uniref:Uncharacterized protein n=1 Tax=Oryza nivara TaxID=4536 RepID=A0A0E0G119_ORYNI
MEGARGRRGGGVARSAAEDGVRHHQARARFFSKVGDADRGAQPRRRRGGGVAPLASLSISESHREVCIPSSSAAVEGTAGETSPPVSDAALEVWRRWLRASTRRSLSSFMDQASSETHAPPPTPRPSPPRVLPPPPLSAARRAKGCRTAVSSASLSRNYSTSSTNSQSPPEPRDSCRDDRSLDIWYTAKEFVKKYPVVLFAQPTDTHSQFHRWVYQEWFKPTVRSLLKCVSDHHASNLEFQEITTENVKIFCNADAPQFIPRIKIYCETRKATYEGRKQNFVQTGELITELIKSSVDNPTEVLDLLSEDIKDKLSMLKNPDLSHDADPRQCGVYILVNHPSMLRREMQSPFYLACYDLLMSVDKRIANRAFRKLPYKNWQSRALQHPLLKDHLINRRSSYGRDKYHQARYHRNVASHKTSWKSKYKAEEVDEIIHHHFPMILTRLMKVLSKMKLLIRLTLHNFFG